MTALTVRSPALLLVAHGTADPDGMAVHHRLADAVRSRRPGLDVGLCWLDVASPSLPEALDSASGPVVIAPALLSIGYHVAIDIPTALDGREDAVQARHLGPDPRVAQVLLERLVEAGGGVGRPAVLVGSGSTDPQARSELAAAGHALARLTGAPVQIAQLSEDDPLAGQPLDLDVASYLLAPGHFARRLAALAAPRRVSAPIGAHPLIAEIVVDRFDEAARLLNRA